MADRSVIEDFLARRRTAPTRTAPVPLPGRMMAPAPFAGPNSFGRVYGPSSVSAPPVNNLSLRFNPAAPLSVTRTPKSQSQNQFLDAMKGETRALIPQRASARTKLVGEAYAQQAGNKTALDQETKFLDSLFKADGGGLVDELANARANRRAGVLARTKLAMDRANRSNNLRRMMSGRNSYNDRLYGNALAGIGAEEAITAADRESEDLRYITGLRSGALGARGRLSGSYIDSLAQPGRLQNESMRDDMSLLDNLARSDEANTIYETPLDQLRREISMRRGMDELDTWSA